MRRFIWLLIAVCLLVGLSGVAAARINESEQNQPVAVMDERLDLGDAAAVRDSFFNDLHIGALWFPSISNKGYIGYYDLSAYYPGGADQSTVWQAGMWAGGYVWDEGEEEFYPLPWHWLGSDASHCDPDLYDSLGLQAVVDTETDLGLPYPYRRLTIRVNTASKPLEVSERGIIDGDMGMTVTFQWHQWGVPDYDHWVFVHVRIEFTKAIDDFYWAWMSDCDVGDVFYHYDYYLDDYAGWDDSLKFCYMRDWDYDPLIGQPPAGSTEDSLFLSPGAVGQYLLAAPPVGGPVTADPDGAQKWVTKNYWDWNNDYSTRQDAYDRIAGIWENPFPSPTAFDYRILNGVGPYDVSAGDTAHFWMAYVVGEGYDEASHATYDLGALVNHVQDAQAFFDGGMVIPAPDIPPQAPDLNPDLDFDVTGDTIRIDWAPYSNIAGGVTADSFFVYQSAVSKLGPWERVAAFDASVTETEIGLVSACTYFWVQAYDTGNQVGSDPYAVSSRLYERDEDGIIRADWSTIVCAESPFTGVPPQPQLANSLSQNYPNPFNPTTTIAYSISSPGEVNLRVYDVSGSLVQVLVNEPKAVGEYRASWDGRDIRGMKAAPGVYFIRLEADWQVKTRTIILLE
ncbi:MAG: T9SS type A sorting domain-containing protein [Candidatus Eisenbacteria bacterium]